jgi:hypothetical protein
VQNTTCKKAVRGSRLAGECSRCISESSGEYFVISGRPGVGRRIAMGYVFDRQQFRESVRK